MSSRFPRRMVLGLLLLGSATGATAFVVHRMATVGPQPDGAILVPNGQALTPAGAHIEVNDRPPSSPRTIRRTASTTWMGTAPWAS